MVEEMENVDVKVEVRTRARKGFEDLYDLVTSKIANLEDEIAREYAARKEELLKFLNGVSETYEVPVTIVEPVTDETTVSGTEVTV